MKLEEKYGSFRSDRTPELIESDDEGLKDVEEVLEEVDGALDSETYEDLAEIYGEENLEDVKPQSYLDDISDGVGCTEIWEEMSERRAQD